MFGREGEMDPPGGEKGGDLPAGEGATYRGRRSGQHGQTSKGREPARPQKEQRERDGCHGQPGKVARAPVPSGQGPRAPKDRDPREGRADQRNHGADDGDDGGRGDGNGERDGVTGGQPGAGPDLLGDHRTVLKKRNRFVGTFVPNRMWLAASGRASMFSRVPRLLPAASSAQVAWSRT